MFLFPKKSDVPCTRILLLPTVLAAAALLVIQYDASWAMGNSGKGQGVGRVKINANANSGSIGSVARQAIRALTVLERQIVTDFFRTTPQLSLPPGLARKQSLPPGLQRQLERNGTLPPGLSSHRMPPGLRGRLPGRENNEILVVGSDVIIIDPLTRAIIDILEVIF